MPTAIGIWTVQGKIEAGYWRKTCGDDQAEDRQDDRQGEEEDQQEQGPGTAVDEPAGDVADGLAVVPDRDDQGAEVVDGADEDRAEDDPEQGRDPSPHHGDRRADDRAGAGDRGEVVAEDDGPGRRHVVLVVSKTVRGADVIGREAEDRPAEPSAVGVIGHDEGQARGQGDQQRLHGGGPALSMFEDPEPNRPIGV